MGTTLLAKKANGENPVATDDDHHEALVSDPSVTSFPQGSTMADTSTGFGGGFGSGNATTPTTGFATGAAAPSTTATGGFGSSSSFGSTTTPSSSFGGSSFGGSSLSAPAGPQPVLTGAGHNAAEGAEVLVANDNTDWINKKWRPVMGWMYMLVCTCDFVVFPVLWSILQSLSHGQVTSQWQPLTLQGAGLFHLSMGAVLGIAAYGRTKEKVAGAA
jgi:hypothetical protein